MSRSVQFTDDAWEQYVAWLSEDKKIVKKINTLIKEIQRDPFNGTGLPEALKNKLSGSWSRRITKEHRVVYKVTDTLVVITQCKFHYDK